MATYASDHPGAAAGIGILIALGLAVGLGFAVYVSKSAAAQREATVKEARTREKAEYEEAQRSFEKLAQQRLDEEAARQAASEKPDTPAPPANDPAPLDAKGQAAPVGEEAAPPAEANEPAGKRQQAFLLKFEDRNIDELNALLAKGWRVVNTCALSGANQFNSRCLVILEKP